MKQEKFPAEVLRLYRREREIAEIVYENDSISAKEVQALLSDPLTNAATRSMLNRLVRKGVLARNRKECSSEYLYRPAVTQVTSQEKALVQLAEDFFEGSLLEAAATLAELALRAGAASQERHAG